MMPDSAPSGSCSFKTPAQACSTFARSAAGALSSHQRQFSGEIPEAASCGLMRRGMLAAFAIRCTIR